MPPIDWFPGFPLCWPCLKGLWHNDSYVVVWNMRRVMLLKFRRVSIEWYKQWLFSPDNSILALLLYCFNFLCTCQKTLETGWMLGKSPGKSCLPLREELQQTSVISVGVLWVLPWVILRSWLEYVTACVLVFPQIIILLFLGSVLNYRQLLDLLTLKIYV